MKRRKYRNMHQYLRALENRAEKGCLRRLVRWFRDVRCIKNCREILWGELDRDRDESDSLRALVVVAVNALHRERTVKASVLGRTEELKVWPASQFDPHDMVLDKAQGERLKIAAVKLAEERDKGFSDPWFHVNDLKPEEGEWVLHAYAGVRAPEYGHFRGGRFFAPSKGGTLPTTHWLRIPDIEANDKAQASP